MTTTNLSTPEITAPPVEKELPAPQYHDIDSKPLIILLVIVLLTALVVMCGIFLWAKQNTI